MLNGVEMLETYELTGDDFKWLDFYCSTMEYAYRRKAIIEATELFEQCDGWGNA